MKYEIFTILSYKSCNKKKNEIYENNIFLTK